MDQEQIAYNRFGLGKRPGERMKLVPKEWLQRQLDSYQKRLHVDEQPPDTQQAFARLAKAHSQAVLGFTQKNAGDNPLMVPLRQQVMEEYWSLVGLRARSAFATDMAFPERLVHFWSNHFAVSFTDMFSRMLAGHFEFDAIRPHVMGRFEDMLLAVETHPSMLLFLDQYQSIGPNSALGSANPNLKREAGLNENLAREIMELHTLGVRSGYSQADVGELARALTGWTLAIRNRTPFFNRVVAERELGDVFFEERFHEPGPRKVLGRVYAQNGKEQSRAILIDLARHPATARHLARKLATHFVADDPPAALVARLERAYLASEGDLPTVYRALIDSPEAWAPEPGKFRNPWQWMVASLRALGPGSELVFAQPDKWLTGSIYELGQPVWQPGSPAGYDDTAKTWASADALLRRVGMADRMARKQPPQTDARALARAVLGEQLSPVTRDSIAAAMSPRDGLVLMLVAPEMMRC